MERPFIDRRQSIIERDDLSKEEVVACDIAHYKGNYKSLLNNEHTIKIQNNKTKEELTRLAEEVYQKHFSTMKERYRENVNQAEQQQDKNIIQRVNNQKGEVR